MELLFLCASVSLSYNEHHDLLLRSKKMYEFVGRLLLNLKVSKFRNIMR